MAPKAYHLFTLAASLLGRACAHPGMHRALADLASLASRQTTTTPELLADLKTLPDNGLSPAGHTIKQILLHNQSIPANDPLTTYTPPGPPDSAACRAETCCIWKHIADDMAAHFKTPSGECNELARQAIRLGFHDAGTWSKSSGPGHGGADGSIILASEWQRKENRGLEQIAHQMQDWYDAWNARYNGVVGMADLIQLGATVAAVSCPLGPRVRSFVGRNDSSVPEPEGRLPEVTDDAKDLEALFADKTISLGELVALVGAHTASTQRTVDSSRPDAPQDGTPGVWDVEWFNVTAGLEPLPPGALVFESDQALARYPAAQEFWGKFADGREEQRVWAEAYAAAYVHLSVLGVEHINDLKECTSVLPLRTSELPKSS